MSPALLPNDQARLVQSALTHADDSLNLARTIQTSLAHFAPPRRLWRRSTPN